MTSDGGGARRGARAVCVQLTMASMLLVAKAPAHATVSVDGQTVERPDAADVMCSQIVYVGAATIVMQAEDMAPV